MAVSLGDAILYLASDDKALKAGLASSESATTSWASKLGGVMKGALTGVVAGAATAAVGAVAAIGTAALNVSNDTRNAAGDIAASLGIPTEEAEKFAEVAKRVYGDNFAGSVGEAADAVALLAQQLKLTADDPSLPGLTEDAFRLRDVFGVEVGESVDAAKTLMENFGLSGEEAFDMIAAGYQKGLDRSGDFIDTIGEYSTQFANGGASAQQFFGLLESGLQGGMLGTDKAADAFKEFRLRIQDGSAATAEGLALLGINAEEMSERLASGTLTAADAFTLVTEAIAATEDPTVRMQAGAALLGSQFEDLGDSAVAGLSLTGAAFADVEGAADSLNAKYSSFGHFFGGLWRRAAVAVSPVTDKLLEMANATLPYIEAAFSSFEKNVIPAMEGVGAVVKRVVDFVKGLFGGLGESTGVLGERFGGLGKKVQEIMDLIRTLVEQRLGWIQAFWETWGGAITALVSGMWNAVRIVFETTLSVILDLVKLVLQVLTGDWQGAADTIRNIVQTMWDGIKALFQNSLNSIREAFRNVDWGEIGRAMMDGIANGIRSGAGRIADAAREAARNALDAAKSWLGISSPSRVTEAEIGRPFVEGIAEGIRRNMVALPAVVNEGLRAVVDASVIPAMNTMKNDLTSLAGALAVEMAPALPAVDPNLTSLAGALAVEMATPAPAVGGGPVTVNVNFNGAIEPEKAAAAVQGGVLDALRQVGYR